MAPFTSNRERDAALAVPIEFVANNRAEHRYPRRGDVVANTVRVRLPNGAPLPQSCVATLWRFVRFDMLVGGRHDRCVAVDRDDEEAFGAEGAAVGNDDVRMSWNGKD